MSDDLTASERDQAILALDAAVGTLLTARNLLARLHTSATATDAPEAPEPAACPHLRKRQIPTFGAAGPTFCDDCGEEV